MIEFDVILTDDNIQYIISNYNQVLIMIITHASHTMPIRIIIIMHDNQHIPAVRYSNNNDNMLYSPPLH